MCCSGLRNDRSALFPRVVEYLSEISHVKSRHDGAWRATCHFRALFLLPPPPALLLLLLLLFVVATLCLFGLFVATRWQRKQK